jgi:hypothetical protein
VVLKTSARRFLQKNTAARCEKNTGAVVLSFLLVLKPCASTAFSLGAGGGGAAARQYGGGFSKIPTPGGG